MPTIRRMGPATKKFGNDGMTPNCITLIFDLGLLLITELLYFYPAWVVSHLGRPQAEETSCRECTVCKAKACLHAVERYAVYLKVD